MDGLTGVSGTPTVADGVAYIDDWTGTLHAVKAATGKQLWSTKIPGGFIVGAPAVDGDGVFASSGHTLYRFKKSTGAKVWEVSTNEHPLSQINASPVVVDGLVLQGVASITDAMGAGIDNTFRGSIGAYNEATGKQVWRFYTTPAGSKAGIGVGIWSTPGVDRRTRAALRGHRQRIQGSDGLAGRLDRRPQLQDGQAQMVEAVHQPRCLRRGQHQGQGRRCGGDPQPLDLRRSRPGRRWRQGRRLPRARSRHRQGRVGDAPDAGERVRW